MRLTNSKRWLLGSLCALGLVSTMTPIVRAADKEEKEVKMKIADVPAAVKDTILKEADGTPVIDVDKEIQDGKTVYEADAKIGKTNYEILVAEDGTLISKKIDKEEEGEKGATTKPAGKKEKTEDKGDKD